MADITQLGFTKYNRRTLVDISMEIDLSDQTQKLSGLDLSGNVIKGMKSLPPWDIDFMTPQNEVYRIRHSDWNFIANSSFESWLSGVTSVPDSWFLQGTATIKRSSTSYQGTYSAEVTFGAASDGELYALFGANDEVDYTYSAYVERISGTGAARMVMQQNFGSYVEEKSVTLPTGSGRQLIMLTAMPTATGNYRINFRAADANGSTWRIDEVKVQESKGIATTWTPRFLDDMDSLTLYGTPKFAGGFEVDTISEYTAGNGVSVDGVSLKDGLVNGIKVEEKSAQLIVVAPTTDTATGNGKAYFHIDSRLNGMNLVDVHAEVITAGTTGTTDIQIYNVTQSADMLSTKITIDSGETGSDTAATAPVIDTGNDDVATNDLLRIDIDAVSTTPAKGLIVTLGFRKP